MTRRTFGIGCIDQCLIILFITFFFDFFNADLEKIFWKRECEWTIDVLVRQSSVLFVFVTLQCFILFLSRFFDCFSTDRFTCLGKLFNISRIDFHIIRFDFILHYFNWLLRRKISHDWERSSFLPHYLLMLPLVLDVDRPQIDIEELVVQYYHVHEGNCLALIAVAMIIVVDPNYVYVCCYKIGHCPIHLHRRVFVSLPIEHDRNFSNAKVL